MGARSAAVADHFRLQGYDAYNVTGGFARWFQDQLPTEPEGATVAQH
jgi:rhodanese-related sulfurtransferase